MKLQESSGVSFSLSFLLQILGAVILGVWGYSQLDARISELAQSSQAYGESITRIDDSMEKNQDMPISADHVQNTSLRFLELEHTELLGRIGRIEQRVYELAVIGSSMPPR